MQQRRLNAAEINFKKCKTTTVSEASGIADTVLCVSVEIPLAESHPFILHSFHEYHVSAFGYSNTILRE